MVVFVEEERHVGKKSWFKMGLMISFLLLLSRLLPVSNCSMYSVISQYSFVFMQIYDGFGLNFNNNKM